MTHATDKPRQSRERALSDHESELWSSVTRAIKPLRQVKAAPPTAAGAASASRRPASPAPAREPPPGGVPSPAATPALGGFDRRFKRRIARGTAEIDARIDLHGLTQAEAHGALIGFLHHARADGARVVLVITGKGADGASLHGSRGVLRRQVPLWLKSPALREHVLAFEPAHSGHGGEGALYVRIRRARRAKAR